MHFKPDIDTREQLPDIATLSVDDIAVLSRTVRSTATGSGDNKVVTTVMESPRKSATSSVSSGRASRQKLSTVNAGRGCLPAW